MTLRAWGLAVLSLVAAGAGMSVLTASSSTTSPVRMDIAAAVLSAYTAAIGLLLTERAERTRLRCLLWGGTVPVLVGVGTAALVVAIAGPGAGMLALLPWLTGALAAWGLGPYVPELRLPRLSSGRQRSEHQPHRRGGFTQRSAADRPPR
jgi:hypothetical protein